jgi:hypothetical protein
VPLERHVAVHQVREEAVVGGGRGGSDGLEADLARRPHADRRVQRPREELATEADAEVGDPPIQRLTDQVRGLLDERLFGRVSHVEGRAEDDDAGHVVERRPRVRAVEGVPDADGPARGLDGRGRDAERLGGVAAHEQDVRHRAGV